MHGSGLNLTVCSSRKHLDVSNWKVRAGSDQLGNFPSLPVSKILVIPHNASNPKEKDIALVKLQLPLIFSGEPRESQVQLPSVPPYSMTTHLVSF